MSDIIYLRNLHLNAIIGPDRWHRSGKAQPIVLSLRLEHELLPAAAKDDVAKTLNYGTLCQEVTQFFKDNTGRWVLHEFAFEVCRLVMYWMVKVTDANEQERKVRVEILLPKGALRVEDGVGVELSMTGSNVDSQVLMVKELKVPCIIGVNPHERVEKQTVVIDLKMKRVREEDLKLNGQPVVKSVAEYVEGSAYETLEALATFIARVICMDFGVGSVTVSLEKPSALPSVDGAGVEITRDREFFQMSDFWHVDSR
ncbi:MAG: trifunctional dihydropteroate synthetase [Pleopsidium flavum]|nr:MAG: trifunctional dihydropteroate synthetase [Pleopsidium flavum]